MRDWGERDPRWRGVRSETVDVQGTVVNLLRAGGPGGTAHLLVHGLGGSATDWLDVIAPLSVDGPVVAVDLPGFGRTEPPTPRAARLLPEVRFLPALMQVLGLSRAVVHGNSMGGTIAVGLAAHRPEAVERLVLAAPALPPPARGSVTSLTALRMAPFVSRRLGERILARLWERMPPEEIHRESMALVLGDPDALRPSVREVGIENTRAVPSLPWRIPSFAHAASDLVSTLTRRTPVHEAMEAVAAPTLLIWGTSDRLVGGPIVDAAQARCPDWHRVDLDGVGHVPMIEAPERYVDAVRSWRMLAEFSTP